MNRRQFLKLLALSAVSPVIKACARIFKVETETPTPAPTSSLAPTGTSTVPASMPEPISGGFFSLHPFIDAHPDAVFIKRTNVAVKTDAEAKRREGIQIAQEVFRVGTSTGIPLSHKIAIKANVTCTDSMGNTEEGMGIVTDRYFMEGMIEGMQALGFQADKMYLREGNWLKDGYCADDLPATGYLEMAERTGIHLLDFSSGHLIADLRLATLEEGTEVVWKDCPDGVVFRRIGYVAPYNQSEAWLLDVAKLKAHSMGMTLSVKNLQGMCVSPHIHFCESVRQILSYPESVLRDFQPNFEEQIALLYAQHVRAGLPRWDRPGMDRDSGYGMELWAQRTCDSLSVTKVGLCIIEGIYGRNGNGFMAGPGPNGRAEDFMTNVLIFGKDPFRVDIVGAWLAGHEPGNFGLFHIAKERGLSSVVNPREIPVYLWEAGNAYLTPLAEFERVPLKTRYLRRDYNGQSETLYHLVDEPFDY